MPDSDEPSVQDVIEEIKRGETAWFERQHGSSRAHAAALQSARVEHLCNRFQRWARRRRIQTENFAPEHWGWHIGSVLPEDKLGVIASRVSKPGGKAWITPNGRVIVEAQSGGVEAIYNRSALNLESLYQTIARHVHGSNYSW